MIEETDIETWVEDFLSELLELAGLDVYIEEISINDENAFTVNLSGKDSARAIGREGQTLEALQHIVVAAAIRSGMAHQRIIIDIEGYRGRREKKVREEAVLTAQNVRNTGNPQDLVPMSARERRLVHMEVSKIDGVTTESFGNGDERHVRVVPV
jgi:spoIIIJ-associated protein